MNTFAIANPSRFTGALWVSPPHWTRRGQRSPLLTKALICISRMVLRTTNSVNEELDICSFHVLAELKSDVCDFLMASFISKERNVERFELPGVSGLDFV